MQYHQDALEGLLDICDEVRSLQDRSRRQPGTNDPRRTDRIRGRVRALRDDVYTLIPGLVGATRAASLTDSEVFALALLFHARVMDREGFLKGGQLVALLARAGFSRTQALELLQPKSSLLAQQWIVVERSSNGGHFPLEAMFRPSLETLDLFWPTAGATEESAATATETPIEAYATEEENLWDFFRWRNLCIQRASSLFDAERPEAQPSPRYRALRRDARAALVRIRARLAATDGGRDFRLERFRRTHKLSFDEMLLVVHFLFAELVEGEPYLSALECVRMVAETRTDLFRKRRLVGARSRLRREGLLKAAHEEFEKSLATDLSLADWVADELLADIGLQPRLQESELDDLLRLDEE